MKTKKTVVWGTGLYASAFMLSIDRDKVSFFIDSDKTKCGNLFFGKKILHPDDVMGWEELFIYVPYNFYEEISLQLRRYGLKENLDFCKYEQQIAVSLEMCKNNYEEACEELKEKQKQLTNRVLFWGRYWAVPDDGKKYFQRWMQEKLEYEVAVVSEAVWMSKEETEKQLDVPCVVAPIVFNSDYYIPCGQVKMIVSEAVDKVKKSSHLMKAVEHLKSIFQHRIDEDSAIYMAALINDYTNRVLDYLKPKAIIAYSSILASRTILQYECEKRGIPLIYMHPGLLPGTISFDVRGEVGRSLPALHYENFDNLTVKYIDLERSKKIWKYLYESKLNRKLQPQNQCIDFIKNSISPGKPIVFFAGQNDVFSHMTPYTNETLKYRSPVFKSSIEAAVYLSKLCKKNDWNFVYKPHPMYMQPELRKQLSDNVIYVGFGDINDIVDISDVVVTILSQTNYVALIRCKPVVMLGYTQSRGKGIMYEAFCKEDIENNIKEALRKGFTKEQKENFVKHIAQLVKYYLYDDMKERKIRYGRDIPKSIDVFFELERLLEGETEQCFSKTT